MTYIFEKIVKTESLFLIIDEQFEEEAERDYMKNVVRDIVHHKLLDMVLDELDVDKKTLFLISLQNEDDHPDLLEKLKDWIEGFEEKLHLKTKEAESEILNKLTDL